MLRYFRILALIFLSLGLICSPHTKAETLLESRIVISELQTESEDSALDDFVELTNRSEDDIDVTGWEIQTKATGATSDWIRRIVLDGIIYAGGLIILSYSDVSHSFLVDIASGHFATGLSTAGGHVRLFDTDSVAEEDKLGWGTATDAELLPAPKPLAPQSLSRKIVDGVLIDTNNNLADFELGEPNPWADNFASEEEEPVVEEPEEEPSEEEPIEEPEEEIPEETPEEELPEETEEDELSLPLLALKINEVFPDPATPETDSEDEWIEIFNPNDTEVNLEGYKLQTGSSFTYSFTFIDIVIASNGYISVSSGESNLVLSNSGGAVRLLDPLGEIMDILATYPEAETSETYAWDGFVWTWTTTPTRDSENMITQPIIEPKVIKAAVKSVKKATTVKKSSTAKKKTATTAKPKKQTTQREVFEDPAAISTEPPLHPGVLA
ncbi:MAG: lamin tail domain-containing protein, partial [Patescibacteria group bacterium]